MKSQIRIKSATALFGIFFLASCGYLREQVKEVKTTELQKAAQRVGPSQPKPLWQTVMHAQEADYVGFVGPDRVLVSEQELIGADLILELEAAAPASGALCLYHAGSGQRLWTYQRRRPGPQQLGILRYSLITDSPYLVLMGVDQDQIVFTALNPDDGTESWEKKFDERTAAALSPDGGRIIAASVGTLSSKIAAIALSDGAVIWERSVKDLKTADGAAPRLVTLENAVLVIGKRLRLISPANGQDIWEIESPFGEQKIISAETRQNRLLVFSEKLAVVLDPASGRRLWGFEAGEETLKSVLLEEKAVYFHTRLESEKGVSDAIAATNPENGKRFWTHSPGGAVRSPLLSYSGRLYYTDDCCIAALESSTGKPVFRSVVPGDFNIALTLRDRTLVLPDLLAVHRENIVAARETYGVVSVLPDSGKIAFAHLVPFSWLEDYTAGARRDALAGKVAYFAHLRHEKDGDEKIARITAESNHAVDTFGASVQRFAAASASSSAFEREQAGRKSKKYTQEISNRMQTGATDVKDLQGLQSGRRLAFQASAMESRGQTAVLGAQRAAIETSQAMNTMMASINFWNSVTGSFFGTIEAAQAAMQRAAISKAQFELIHAQALHWRSLQNGIYVRPYKYSIDPKSISSGYANGVVLVDLDSGERSDFIIGVTDYDLTDHGLEFPTFAVGEDGDLLVTDAIGLDVSRFEQYELGNYDLPYPSLLAFSIPSLPFAKQASFANPDLKAVAGMGKMDSVRKLVAVDPQKASLDAYGAEALMNAARRGHIEVARYLIEKGVDFDSVISKETPLQVAASSGNKELVQFLLQKGADVNGSGMFSSPLANAATEGNLEIARILVVAGADVNKPKGWFSPLARAKRKKEACKDACKKPYDEIITLLVESGAKDGP